MFAKRIIAIAALIAMTSGTAFAQAAAPGVPAKPMAPPVVTAPAKPVVVAPAPVAPVAAKTNLNTASAADLDKLPQIGAARSKAIIDARTTKKFKDWADFTSRNIVPSNAEAAIKDMVSF